MLKEINAVTNYLVIEGFADDQNYPFANEGSGTTLIRFPSQLEFSSFLKEEPYRNVYLSQLEARAFNIRMLDGALIQMLYEFDNNTDSLVRSRLAFLPAPDLLHFQDNPDLYEDELLYADVIDQRVVTVPFRFDFDDRPNIPVPVSHPVAHLTLGQYSGCRIPATSAPTPYLFMLFVLRSFYNTAFSNIAADLPTQAHRFPACIHADERRVIHVGVPLS
ncbi:MAG TPA: DUF2290 domain-containing protein [Acidimicrobiales bacterium]|jgi:hypothetical protein|nr:DUF2290 domain-containing protein [Acidimicrobiales bacterium]